MKSKYSLAIVMAFVVLSGCFDNNRVKEVPEDIIPTVPCPTLYGRIMQLFPERQLSENQVLFSDTVQKKVVIVKDTDLYITFIAEGAGYANTLGYYTYQVDSPPSSPAQVEHHVLFPNASDEVLSSGNRLKIRDEKFTKGTVVGFYLIIAGWQRGVIDDKRQKFYTNYAWNPGARQQHILFEEKTCGDIVLAFEDLSASEESDGDFNDLLFTVSDNNSDLVNTAFEKKGLVVY